MSGDRLARVLAYIADDAAGRGASVSSQTACDAAVRLIDVSGAQVTLMNSPDRGESRYSTDLIGGRLEELRFALGEGPCADAFRSGVPVLVEELDSGQNHRRWPMFVPAALDAGARAVFAFPLRSGAIRTGALVLHRKRIGPLTAEQVADSLVIADVILSLLLDELTRVRVGLPVDGVPMSRGEIHQATGMVSVQLGVGVEEALVRLRAHAFANERPVIDVARDVVARRLRLNPADASDPSSGD
ncbi:GAF and ANTAR domain-containing protein [Lentzea tibetensis]|uniref:GAF and ANTAR domain-containing protein n=1 Tax=Lentzea tibetensis TaxID=2591470 RepID=A0A563ENF5_9PSEU|nr:GAF and ANTAR domain-containing protein [Lentzea tibetensis]TWP48665.1 GAF and ANTAR domain-containing protein [Lentzea tibetensis]